MLRRKQNCWPVFFLTNIGTPEAPIGPDDDYDFNHWDHRCLGYEGAIHFAESGINRNRNNISLMMNMPCLNISLINSIALGNSEIFTSVFTF